MTSNRLWARIILAIWNAKNEKKYVTTQFRQVDLRKAPKTSQLNRIKKGDRMIMSGWASRILTIKNKTGIMSSWRCEEHNWCLPLVASSGGSAIAAQWDPCLDDDLSAKTLQVMHSCRAVSGNGDNRNYRSFQALSAGATFQWFSTSLGTQSRFVMKWGKFAIQVRRISVISNYDILLVNEATKLRAVIASRLRNARVCSLRVCDWCTQSLFEIQLISSSVLIFVVQWEIAHTLTGRRMHAHQHRGAHHHRCAATLLPEANTSHEPSANVQLPVHLPNRKNLLYASPKGSNKSALLLERTQYSTHAHRRAHAIIRFFFRAALHAAVPLTEFIFVVAGKPTTAALEWKASWLFFARRIGRVATR